MWSAFYSILKRNVGRLGGQSTRKNGQELSLP